MVVCRGLQVLIVSVGVKANGYPTFAEHIGSCQAEMEPCAPHRPYWWARDTRFPKFPTIIQRKQSTCQKMALIRNGLALSRNQVLMVDHSKDALSVGWYRTKGPICLSMRQPNC